MGPIGNGGVRVGLRRRIFRFSAVEEEDSPQ